MRVNDVASNLMFGEHPYYGGHAADRGGIGTEVVNNQVARQGLGGRSWVGVGAMWFTCTVSRGFKGRCSSQLDPWQGQDGGDDQRSGVARGAVEQRVICE